MAFLACQNQLLCLALLSAAPCDPVARVATWPDPTAPHAPYLSIFLNETTSWTQIFQTQPSQEDPALFQAPRCSLPDPLGVELCLVFGFTLSFRRKHTGVRAGCCLHMAMCPILLGLFHLLYRGAPLVRSQSLSRWMPYPGLAYPSIACCISCSMPFAYGLAGSTFPRCVSKLGRGCLSSADHRPPLRGLAWKHWIRCWQLLRALLACWNQKQHLGACPKSQCCVPRAFRLDFPTSYPHQAEHIIDSGLALVVAWWA